MMYENTNLCPVCRALCVLTRVPPDCTVLGVASSVIVTMGHLVTMWMVAANACQDIQEAWWVRKQYNNNNINISQLNFTSLQILQIYE